jgi:restriction endonuclease S subunit
MIPLPTPPKQKQIRKSLSERIEAIRDNKEARARKKRKDAAQNPKPVI